MWGSRLLRRVRSIAGRKPVIGNSSAYTFACRLTFFISHPLCTDRGALTLSFRGQLLTLRPSTDGRLQDARELVAISRGHPTETSARELGLALKDAFLASAIEARIGVDVGMDRPRGGPGKYLADLALGERGVVLMHDVHGLSVYPDDGKHVVFGASATIPRNISAERFAEVFNMVDKRRTTLDKKTRIAAELLGASFFGQSSYATLFLSIAAVEAVSSRGTRSSEYCRTLDLGYICRRA